MERANLSHVDAFKQANPRYVEVSVAHKFAEIIWRINPDESISTLLE